MNNNYTIGVEEEYMLCDSNSGELVSLANVVFDSIPTHMKNRFSYELLLSEIESNTSITDNTDEAINEIISYRNILKEIGIKNNYKIGISGTHPTSLPVDQKFVCNQSYKWVSEQLQYYAKRNITFSIHIHIGLESKDMLIPVCNSLRRWIAPMLALSANSPFFAGCKTGMQSTRTLQFSSFPRTNIPPFIKDLLEYENIIEKYIKSKSINKPGQIWWKIRPHLKFQTIEFRVCDIQRSILKTEMLIALVQSLVRTINENYYEQNKNYNYEYLLDGLWKSSKFGINCKVIDPEDLKIISMKKMIKRMLEYSKKSLLYFGNSHIIKYVEDILKNGNEASEQLKIYNKFDFIYLKQFLMDTVDYKYNKCKEL